MTDPELSNRDTRVTKTEDSWLGRGGGRVLGDDKWVNKLISDTDKGTKEWIEMRDVTGNACAGALL